MTNYSPAWPHSDIKEIFPNIFYVMGTNKTTHEGVDLQHSRNMIIVRHDKQLSLINTVRLDENGLQALNKLGEVKNVVRIGAFHGRDDAFYLDRYHAKFWALKGMQDQHGHAIDVELSENGRMPFPECSLFIFETSVFAEGILHLDQEGGILITCDSIKNWLTADEYFNNTSATLYKEQGFFGPANISTVWKEACQVKVSDFKKLQQLSFHHLLSAHGEPLLNDAYEKVADSVRQAFTS